MTDTDPPYLQTPGQWTSFLSALVHELRTPLASFRILADLLAEAPPGRLGDPERRYAESIREVVKDIQSLVGDVGELARLLAGRFALRESEVAPEALVDQVEETVRTRAWQDGIVFLNTLDPGLPPAIRTDPDRLRQTLALLLGALVGQAKTEVSFRVEREDGLLRIVLTSDGPPFADTELTTLFAPFPEGARSARPRGGRSLALTLAHELARTLGGSLRAENLGGRPAFVLRLAGVAAPGG